VIGGFVKNTLMLGEEAMSLTEKIKQKAKTKKEIVESHKEDYKQVQSELKKAYGGVAVASANARFKQKENEKWVRLDDVLALLGNYYEEVAKLLNNLCKFIIKESEMEAPSLGRTIISFIKEEGLEAKVAELKEVEN